MKTLNHLTCPNHTSHNLNICAAIFVAGLMISVGPYKSGAADMTNVAAKTAADTSIYRPTLKVAPTDRQGVVDYWQPAIGSGLGQMLITELSSLPNFTVLESLALEDLRDERRLGENGEVSEAESVKKGGWHGADYLFKSTITRFGNKKTGFGGHGIRPPIPLPFHGLFGDGFVVQRSTSEVQIDWRIVDYATGDVVKAGRGCGTNTGTSFNFSSWAGGGFNNNQEFQDSALGKATMKAIAQIIDQVRPLNLGPGGRTLNNAKLQEDAATKSKQETEDANKALRSVKGTVTGTDGKEIWLSLGANNRLKKGDHVKIYQPVEKKNQSGKVYATTYKEIAEITLEKVQKETSMGHSDVQIKEGWAAAAAEVDIDNL